MAKKWTTPRNYKVLPAHSEKMSGVSQTVIGESLTIQELIARQLNGIDPQPAIPVYMDQEDLDKIGRYYRPINDLTDLDNLRDENAALALQIKRFEESQKQEEEEKPESPASEQPKTEDD